MVAGEGRATTDGANHHGSATRSSNEYPGEADNGVGKPDAAVPPKRAGRGADLVAALARQLDVRAELVNRSDGLKVAVIRAGFDSKLSGPA